MRIKNAIARRFKNLKKFLINPSSYTKEAGIEAGRISNALDEMRILASPAPSEVTFASVIFSKDRPLQLHALLKSIRDKIKGLSELHIIYGASDESFNLAYKEVFSQFPELNIEVSNDSCGFRPCLVKVLEALNSSHLFFLVDDIIVLKNVDLNGIKEVDPLKAIFSLRLGKGITYCYMQKKTQPLPKNFKSEKDRTYWTWSEGELDWNYPLSVDGHVFLKREIEIMTRALSFKAPNSYEASLQKFRKQFLNRRGESFSFPALFNNPCNMVQTEITENLSGDLNPYELLGKWNDGFEIDLNPFDGFLPKGVHQEMPLSFVKRS